MIQCFANNNRSGELFKENSAKLIYACRTSKEEPIRAMHSHKHILEIMLITDGEGVFIISGKRYDVSAGNIIIINSNVVHEELSNTENPMSQYCLGMSKLRLKGLPENHLISKDIMPVSFLQDNFILYKRLFETAYNQLYYSKNLSEEVCSSIVATITSLLVQDIGEGRIIQQSTEFIIKRAREFIESNFNNELTLDKIAKELNISRYYLSRLFKEKSGYSINEYINRLRIGEAQNLLISTEYQIAEIGNMVGINDPSYFNLIFNRVVGTQPAKYRKSYRSHNFQ